MQTLEDEDAEFEFDSLANREPMQSVSDIVGDRIEFPFSQDEASCRPGVSSIDSNDGVLGKGFRQFQYSVREC